MDPRSDSDLISREGGTVVKVAVIDSGRHRRFVKIGLTIVQICLGFFGSGMARVVGAQAKPDSVTVSSNAYSISGVVRDNVGEPLALAEVSTSSGLFEVSRKDGSFLITGVPVGATEVTFKRVGYMPATLKLEGAPGIVVSLAATLRPVDAVLGTIVVKEKRVDPELAENGFYARQKRGLGFFIEQEEIDKEKGALGALLRHAPFIRLDEKSGGVRVPVELSAGGWLCPLDVFVDGKEFPYMSYHGIDAVVNLQQLKAVEIYRDKHDAPYGVTTRSGNFPIKGEIHGCGTVMLWTK